RRVMSTTSVPTRRTFIRTASTALSVPLAAASPAVAAPAVDLQAARLAHLEDVEAIRALAQAFARHVNAGARDAAAALFADPSRAAIDPELCAVSAEGFGGEDAIEIAPDRGTARAVLHGTVRFERPIGPDGPLVEMARQQ